MTAASSPRSVFGSRRFEGSVSGENWIVPVVFAAEVDARGELQLAFDPLPLTAETLKLRTGESGQKALQWVLRGQGPAGETIHSTTFSITGYTHHVAEESEISFSGVCSQADIVEIIPQPLPYAELRWAMRRFRSFNWLQHPIEGGTIYAGGAAPDSQDSQLLTGTIIVKADVANVAPSWWVEADAHADHLRRVLSLASSVYLLPYVEIRLEGRERRLKVLRRSKAPKPFLPPFHFLNLGPIFTTACTPTPEVRARFLQLDSALRWLLAPGHYDESRLLGAMTALENIVEGAYPSNKFPIVTKSAFEKFAKKVRTLIREENLPEAVIKKVPELNRDSFIDKVQRYVDEHGIVTADFPNGGLDPVIKARNAVVHTGIYFKDTPGQIDLWDHILVARELVTRILLDALEFEGNYFSYLHGDQQLRFPSCRRLTDAQMHEIPIDDPSGEPRPPIRPAARPDSPEETAQSDNAEPDGQIRDRELRQGRT